jgi:hypothetical protein
MSRSLLLEHEPTPAGCINDGVRLDLNGIAGFLVADARGRVVGRVEGRMDGGSPEIPDALSVRFTVLRWRRCFIPADAIEAIDERTRVIGLRIERSRALGPRHCRLRQGAHRDLADGGDAQQRRHQRLRPPRQPANYPTWRR